MGSSRLMYVFTLKVELRYLVGRARCSFVSTVLRALPRFCYSESPTMAASAYAASDPTAPVWLNKGDNAWQLTAATLVGLQSVPGLVVLYAGIVKKKWEDDHHRRSLTIL